MGSGYGTYVVAREMVDYAKLADGEDIACSATHTRGLGQHGVVLELRFPERRSVASNDDELGLASTEALEGGLVS